MRTGKGIVKKYSREYNRTLKNGEKKKYTTKQIQITIPKHNDIYEDKEEVLIIPQNEIEEFKNLEDKVNALEIANYLYSANTDNASQEESSKLKEKYSQLIEEHENVKTKFISIKEENENLKESYNRIRSKYDSLKQETLNTKTSYANIFEANEKLEKELKSMYEEYNELVDKYNKIEEENYFLKSNKNHDEYIANRIKEFILKTD